VSLYESDGMSFVNFADGTIYQISSVRPLAIST
jgi:hypothetical protein